MYPPRPCLATLSSISATFLPPGLASVFTHADARRAGWSNRALYAARDNGNIQCVARGIYARPDLQADLDLVEVAVRAPDATICLTSALAHHDLADDIPPSVNVALPRSRRVPRTRAPVTWHRFDEDTFEIGRMPLDIVDQLSIGLYSPARSVIDAYRLRHLYGAEQATGALKRWLARPGSHPSDLLAMARHFPAARMAIRAALQILL